MAFPKTWLKSVPEILKVLTESEFSDFSRSEVEVLFGVSRATAARIMAEAGGGKCKSAGVARKIRKQKLIAFLTSDCVRNEFEADEARRAQLAEQIAVAQKEAQLRAVKLPAVRLQRWPGINELPNVYIDSGILRVVFSSPEGLLVELYSVVMAAQQNLPAFRQDCMAGFPESSPETASGDGGREMEILSEVEAAHGGGEAVQEGVACRTSESPAAEPAFAAQI